jgi:predicted RNase H-like HicB family nuclease
VKIRRKGNELIIEKSLRCYAIKEGDHFFACCIDMGLADQGATLAEAKANLSSLIEDYIKIALEDLQPGEELFRPASLGFRLEYYKVWLFCHLSSLWRRLNRSSYCQTFKCTPAHA